MTWLIQSQLSRLLWLFWFMLVSVTALPSQEHIEEDLIDTGEKRKCIPGQSSGGMFRLKLKVMTYGRSDSLARLLDSLSNADYLGDCVDIDIFIDYSTNLTMNEAVIAVSEKFIWSHGEKRIHERIVNVGVIGQWLEAWNPASDHEYGLFLEDDMEVSPIFYRWTKAAVKRFYFPLLPDANDLSFGPRSLFNSYSTKHYDRLFGLSLQRLLIISSLRPPVGTLPIKNGNMPFAYQLTGTWGQLYFPRPWKEFRTWFRQRRHEQGYKPIVEGLINTKWYYQSGDNAWEQWVIRWSHDTGRFCIYSNLPGNQCLATNHRELGNNYHKKLGVDCKLVKRKFRDLLNFPRDLQFYNFSLLPINPDLLPNLS